MRREWFLLIFILCFSAGVFAGSFFAYLYASLFFIFLGMALLVIRRSVLKIYAVLVLISFGMGIFYYGFRSAPPADVSNFENRINETIVMRGVVIGEPDERENYTGLTVEVGGVNFLILSKHHPAFKYGDELEIKGVVEKPVNFSDFDYRAYLAKDDIYFQMFYPEIELVSSGNGFWHKRFLFSFKEKLIWNVSRVIPEPYSALWGGLTLGAKRSMPPDLLEDFRETGIIHIVVLSGYNITVVADAIMRLLSFLPQYIGISFGILGILGFAIMTGASATIVRASVMAIMVLLARATGRIYQVTTALLFAGFIMILHNPQIVRFDSSFQLSFLATLALIYLAPLVEKRLRFLPKKWQIRDLASATLSTQIFVLPLLLYKMGLFSVVSLPVNLLILIFVPATMLFGFITAVAGFLSTYISMPFAWITYGLLAYEIKVVELFSALPFASVSLENFPLWLMLSAYAGYAILIFKYGFFAKKS